MNKILMPGKMIAAAGAATSSNKLQVIGFDIIQTFLVDVPSSANPTVASDSK